MILRLMIMLHILFFVCLFEFCKSPKTHHEEVTCNRVSCYFPANLQPFLIKLRLSLPKILAVSMKRIVFILFISTFLFLQPENEQHTQQNTQNILISKQLAKNNDFLLRCLKFPNAQICCGNDYLRSVMQLGNGLILWSYNGSQYGFPPVGSFLHSITIYLFVLFSFGSPGADTFLNLSIVAGKLAYSVNKYFKLL